MHQKQLGFENRSKHQGENVFKLTFKQYWAVTGISFLEAHGRTITIQNDHD